MSDLVKPILFRIALVLLYLAIYLTAYKLAGLPVAVLLLVFDIGIVRAFGDWRT